MKKCKIRKIWKNVKYEKLENMEHWKIMENMKIMKIETYGNSVFLQKVCFTLKQKELDDSVFFSDRGAGVSMCHFKEDF